MIKIKICGIRKLEEAQVAAEAGADFIGLVFVPGRPRRLEIDDAREITAGIKKLGAGAPRVVGLFAGQPLNEVNRTVQECGLDLAQLCGLEPLDYCGSTEADVIKVVHVAADIGINQETDQPVGEVGSAQQGLQELEELVASYTREGHIVTLDRLVDGIPGGTGQSFDWEVAAHLSRRENSFILAGGLTPETVAKAVTTVHPWGVDVSSGVETRGVKDPSKIRAFIKNARSATQNGNPKEAQGV